MVFTMDDVYRWCLQLMVVGVWADSASADGVEYSYNFGFDSQLTIKGETCFMNIEKHFVNFIFERFELS